MTEDEKQKAGLAPYCPCGSGEYREAQYDGYGIFLTYTCHKCHKSKMRGYRSDIMERYECDEPIEDEYGRTPQDRYTDEWGDHSSIYDLDY